MVRPNDGPGRTALFPGHAMGPLRVHPELTHRRVGRPEAAGRLPRYRSGTPQVPGPGHGSPSHLPFECHSSERGQERRCTRPVSTLLNSYKGRTPTIAARAVSRSRPPRAPCMPRPSPQVIP
ncbi:hypothetical protein GCM10010327_07570 [Streptomyces nitrosporeus]|nr:hypothetical protein GCM10010327_07570 [Streptomyces nitrosporeus]